MHDQKLLLFYDWCLKMIFKIGYFFLHIIQVFHYWGKGKTVPTVTNNLLLLSATKIAEKIRNGQLKSEDVVMAYIDRITEVEPLINAVAESRFHEAIIEAKEIDNLVKSGKLTTQQLKDEKPLLGVPITIKVLLNVKGLRNTGASMIFKDSPLATSDAPTVAQLKEAGAIVLATSNSAELGLGYDATNLIYGRTCNPYDTNRNPGGSSGGEGALIGAAASVLGLGNDLFGSLRIPAHFTGIYSHKPSRGLLISNVGCNPIPTKETTKFLETGPMCRYVDDLITTMKILSSNNPDKVDFNREINFGSLKIFYQINIDDVSFCTVDREIEAGIRSAVHHFATRYGATAEEVNIKLLASTSNVALSYLLDDIPNIINHVSEGKVESINGILEILKFVFGKSRYSLYAIVEASLGKFLTNEKKIVYSRTLFEKLGEKFESMLDENSIFILSTLPFVATREYEMIPLIANSIFTGVFNLLGLPVTQCPIGLNHEGLPQGMQIIARMNNDRLTLACAEELDKVFGGWIPPS